MLIQCPICAELLTESATVVGLSCGHLFHEVCLLKWFDNKCNCPQCRTQCRKNSAFKIYFSISSGVNCSTFISDDEQKYRLNEDLSAARLSLKEKSLQNALLIEEKSRDKERIKELTDRLKKSEDLQKQEKSQMIVLQQELKTCMTSLGLTSRENLELKRTVETLGNVQLVINGCDEEIESLVSTSTDVKQLATWCSVYRKELERKKMDLRLALDTTRRLRKEAESHKGKWEISAARVKQLEEDDLNNKEVISGLEDQLKSLTKKMVALQAAINSPRHTSKSLVHRLLHESPAPMNMSHFNDSISTPLPPRSQVATTPKATGDAPPEDSKAGEKENRASRKRKSPDEEQNHDKMPLTSVSETSNQMSEEKSKDKSKVNAIPAKKLKKRNEPSDPVTVRNPLLELGIFKRHNSLNGVKSSTFVTSNSSSSSSGAMVVRKGYNGLGGHEKYVGPNISREKNAPGLTAKPLLPSVAPEKIWGL